MKIRQICTKKSLGMALIVTTATAAGLMITVASVLGLSVFRHQATFQRTRWNESYYHAENALVWATQKIADADTGGTSASFLGSYSVTASSLSLPYMQALHETSPVFQNASVQIENSSSGVDNLYTVTASAKVGGKIRTLQATVKKNPASQVFDYEYFLNNWGWWWGTPIFGQGDNRSNWDFDFKDHPTANGSVIANGSICSNGNPIDPLDKGSLPFYGKAYDDATNYVHSGVPRLPMPNLKDFTTYKDKARSQNGTIKIGTETVVSAVHDNVSKPGLYLDGTTTPIIFSGSTVVDGDLVIKGTIAGTGTVYVGGNLYVAGNLTYSNGPVFSPPPVSLSTNDRNNWVTQSTNKSLVAFAVRESVLGGNPNDTDNWYPYCFNNDSYGMKNLGGEMGLGADGIKHTHDDLIPYLDTNHDGIPDSTWYDADGDGIIDPVYDYNRDVKMNDTRANKIDRYPQSDSHPVNFNTLASNNINRLDGVFYCNHAMAMRLTGSNPIFNGAVISRDEAIVFNGGNTLNFVYDYRIHSRYNDDPNRFIDLGLPIARRVGIYHFAEINPVEDL